MPHRVSHDLTDRQRLILLSLAASSKKGITFAEIKLKLSDPAADRTVRDDFQHLKRLGLVDIAGRGRGARWFLTLQNENKAE